MNKILIVDDHPENIQLIARILETSFPAVRLYQAVGVASARKLMEQISFDLVISDWDMPGMTGIDLIRWLKGDPKTAHIPVVIVTAIMLTAENLGMALSAGAHDYLRNPVDPLELIARVSAALTLSRCHLNEIQEKDLQLMEKTLIHVKNNEFDISMTRDLEKLLEKSAGNDGLMQSVKQLIGKMEQKIREDSWKSFEVSFQNIHSDFIKNLLLRFPGLTKSELRLCILLKLGMNTKDIASMLYLSPESLKVSRSRLRAKLGMPECDSFHTWLSAF
jgi:DNA-binding response OmpR family regulator/DNA-binding CsgD family transcriptional regulator